MMMMTMMTMLCPHKYNDTKRSYTLFSQVFDALRPATFLSWW
uniref:Uncharacterized protein n=1 Tax=Anopheles arabiensis TaxID=7173 RepID=A0A182IH46_ANOAR